MNAQMEKLKLDWLTRMAMSREVFVFADELGPQFRFVRGIEACAPFLEPWASGFQLRYFNGLLAWGVPLGRILARIPREDFLEVIRKADSPWVKGRPWPLAAIDWLARGKDIVARRILDKELLLLQPNDLHRMNAASIWFYLLGDRDKAKMELEAAGAIQKAEPETDPHRNELARRWSEMFGDQEKARTAINQEIMALANMPDTYSYCEQALAGALRLTLENAQLAKKYVPDADRLGQADCDWHGMDAAICWLALFDNQEMAKACVEFGKTQASENPATHAMICRYVFEDEAGARSILENRGEAKGWPQGVGPIRWAEGWLQAFEDMEPAVVYLEKITPDDGADMNLDAALAWGLLMGFHQHYEAVLPHVLHDNDNLPGAMFQYAERLVSDCGAFHAARNVLNSAEKQYLASSAKPNSAILAEFARVWWQALADRTESERCLQKAWDVAQTAGDLQHAFYMEELLSWKWSETYEPKPESAP